MKASAPQFWASKNWKSVSLLPLSWLYQQLAKLDKSMKEKKSYRPQIPVIVVGNLTVGGNGKTPLVALLAEHFKSQGETVAILSRGYGGTNVDAHQVMESDTTKEVGDEPKMLLTMGVANQVWVGHDRRETAKLAELAGATLLILDDGFQHWKLERDVDIVVIDGNYAFGNEYTLPAGPLREPKENISRADFAVVMNDRISNLPIPSVKARRYPNNQDLVSVLDRELFVFCGIGLPMQFINGLEKAELRISGRKFYPDHHDYTEDDIKYLLKRSQDLRTQLVTTPKDAEKLPVAFRKRCLIIRPSFVKADATKIIKHTEQSLKQSKFGRNMACFAKKGANLKPVVDGKENKNTKAS